MNKLKDESGYTLIEVLVAIVLLLIVLIPMSQFLGNILYNNHNVDKINAINLAESEIESCILKSDYFEKEYVSTIDGKEYIVTRKIEYQDNLIKITVFVKKQSRSSILASFYSIQKAE